MDGGDFAKICQAERFHLILVRNDFSLLLKIPDPVSPRHTAETGFFIYSKPFFTMNKLLPLLTGLLLAFSASAQVTCEPIFPSVNDEVTI